MGVCEDHLRTLGGTTGGRGGNGVLCGSIDLNLALVL